MKKVTSKLIPLLTITLLSFATLCSAENKNDHQSDTWLQAKLGTTMLLNRHLSLFDINVDVRDQVAYLDGAVESAVEKDLAEQVAKSIEGIKDVKNDIKIAANSVSKEQMARERTFSQVIDDLTTTASIKSQLLVNSNTKAIGIDVDTFKNTVTLKGTVKTDKESSLIEQIAKNTDGVKDVNNQLRVNAAS